MSGTVLLAGLIFLALVVLVILPKRLAGRGSRILAFLALFVVPIGLFGAGFGFHYEAAKTTEFCLSCHDMELHGKSLWADDTGLLAAAHFQNGRIPRGEACFTCHTDYALFGDERAKLRGMKHVWIHYLGDPPPEVDIRLYTPYQNRECLHCHDHTRSFAENDAHVDDLPGLRAQETSCLECHGPVHDVARVASLPRWEPR